MNVVDFFINAHTYVLIEDESGPIAHQPVIYQVVLAIIAEIAMLHPTVLILIHIPRFICTEHLFPVYLIGQIFTI